MKLFRRMWYSLWLYWQNQHDVSKLSKPSVALFVCIPNLDVAVIWIFFYQPI